MTSTDLLKTRSSGRPRSETCRHAILKAAYRLLKRHCINEVSAHQIASEAGVSTATLYRWWPTKEAVLLDSFLETFTDRVTARTGRSPLERLREHALLSARFLRSEDGRVVVRLLVAIQSNEELRKEFVERFYLPRRAAGLAIIQDAVAAGELRDQVNAELLLDSIYGPQYLRVLIGQASVTDSFASRIFDAAIASALPPKRVHRNYTDE